MKGAGGGWCKGWSPPSSAACLCGPPLMMSTAGVTCYQQDPRPDRRLSITSRHEGNPASPPLFISSSSITTTDRKGKFRNMAFIFDIGIHFKDNSNLIQYGKHLPSTAVLHSGWMWHWREAEVGPRSRAALTLSILLHSRKVPAPSGFPVAR